MGRERTSKSYFLSQSTWNVNDKSLPHIMTGRDIFIMEASMHRYHLRQTLPGFILLLAIIACGLPAQSSPTPVTNPSSVETSLASTARALAQQTETAQGFTATPSVVPTLTLTPTPKISSAGSSLENLADGSVRFTDHLAGMQMIFPSVWLVFRVGEPEYYAAWEKQGMKNPQLQNVFASLNTLDPKVLRVVAFDLREDHMPDGLVTASSVVFLAGDTLPLEEWEKTRKAKPNPCAGFKFISSGYSQTDSDIRTLVMDVSCSTAGDASVYYRDVYFSLSSGTVHLSFETNLGYKDDPLHELEQVINSIRLLNP
jgi:hypothetical protein